MRTVYALIWKSTFEDDRFDEAEFDRRLPLVMDWLSDLKSRGQLRAAGGGGFLHNGGGLTIVEVDAESSDKALLEVIDIAERNPLNEIGFTTIMAWDLVYADLVEGAGRPVKKSYMTN